MLNKQYVRDNIDLVKEKLSHRGTHCELLIDEFITLDNQRKQLLLQYENLKAYQNIKSKEIAKLKKSNIDTSEIILEMKTVSNNIKVIEQQLVDTEKKLDDIMLIIPNIPHDSVPIGKNEKDNIEVYRWESNKIPMEEIEELFIEMDHYIIRLENIINNIDIIQIYLKSE